MRNLYEFTPKKNTKKLGMITGVLIIGAAVLMLFTILFGEKMPYRWTIQLLSLLMLALGVFITARYIMKSYSYAVIEDNGQLDLAVTEMQGRHTVTVCRIALSGIEELRTLEAGDKSTGTEVKNKIRREKRKSFNYCGDLLDEKCVCIFTVECGESLAIKISYDGRLVEMLEQNGNE